jgi:hypothetical protein
MTFREQLIVTVVDKLAIGALILLVGWWLNRRLEIFRGQQAIKNEIEKLRHSKQIELLEKQLSQFYYPIYVRLNIDGAVWERILDKQNGDDELRRKVGDSIERNLMLPNHEEIVRIIQSNIHLAETDPEAFRIMLRYIRHVSVYKAMREAGCHDRDPISLGEPWPKDFLPKIEETTAKLQVRYDSLTASSIGST